MGLPSGWTTVQLAPKTKNRLNNGKQTENDLHLIGTDTRPRKIITDDFINRLLDMYETLVKQENNNA